MSVEDDLLRNLQDNLAHFGFTQPLPLSAYPLVYNLFMDFMKTTKSLKDSKLYICDLLDEQKCWELGVEPYRCENARLMAECNEVHNKMIKECEDLQKTNLATKRELRAAQHDNKHLGEHCQQLQEQIKSLQTNKSPKSPSKKGKKSPVKATKPFVSTVRTGGQFPVLSSNSEHPRCSKCHTISHGHRSREPGTATLEANAYMEQLHLDLQNLHDELNLYKAAVDGREKEIRRLTGLLSDGRPVKALAKECCYKEVQSLKSDNALLRREIQQLQCKAQEYQDKMHEAMQKAIKQQEHLQLVQAAALRVEDQANKEIEERYSEIETMRIEIKQLREHFEGDRMKGGSAAAEEEEAENDGEAENSAASNDGDGDRSGYVQNERSHELNERERKMFDETQALARKCLKLKAKVNILQKELKNQNQLKNVTMTEDNVRLRAERDFFQKEYLRLLSKSGSDKEVEFLQNQVKSKDEELRILRIELCARPQYALPPATVYTTAGNQTSARTEGGQSGRSSTPSCTTTTNNTQTLMSDCVQAAILRAERERDCALAELERVRLERDTVREKHLSEMQVRQQEVDKQKQHTDELLEKLSQLQRENRILTSARLPGDTKIVLLKEELDAVKKRMFALQEEHNALKQSHSQLKVLHGQTEYSMLDYQGKLALAEGRADAAELRLNQIDTSRDTNQRELQQLRSTVESLRNTYLGLENEKDDLAAQLDSKSEQAAKCERDLKVCNEKRKSLEEQVKEMEQELENLKSESRERGTVLSETSAQTKHLRQQITALKNSRDKAIAENSQLSNELANSRAEISTLNRRLQEAEAEVNRLKQQLREYVKEVKKAEDLLMHKEKEREEMLEHYRSLSQDACMLEGNNQSLETEAAEYKRQVYELEAEIETLKKELCCRNSFIQQLEDKIVTLTSQLTCVEHQLEEAHDEQRLLKVDLAARKELCDKLDIEKEKLNAELHELNEIRGKLERENEQIRSDVERNNSGTKVCSDTLEELLAQTRQDLEEQLRLDRELSQQCVRLRQQNENLIGDLKKERMRCEQNETLAREFQVQNQELRHNLTDDRFRQARSREQSPRFPTQTL